ncbi:MAG: polysaccharide deacetylase family protein [Armatimonadetes bacterium]|nr:polysaccharide deacetylase family protein [Armatimonadota bacterium]
MTSWPWNASCVISLTYDGGLIDHSELVLPQLDDLGFKGTFYVPNDFLIESGEDWREMARNGHEIGIGTLFDPYLSTSEDTFEANLMDVHTGAQLVWELTQSRTTLGIPWLDDSSFDLLQVQRELVTQYPVVRSGSEGLNTQDLRWNDLKILRCEEYSGRELIQLARKAIESKAWAIFSFRGVGVGEPSVDLRAHFELMTFLLNCDDSVRIEPVANVARELCPEFVNWSVAEGEGFIL